MLFLERLPDLIFLIFSGILCKNDDFWTPPGPSWRPKWLPNPVFFGKTHEKSIRRGPFYAFLVPYGAPAAARIAPDLLFTHSGSIPTPFSIDVGLFFHVLR